MDRHVNPHPQDIGHDGHEAPTNRASKSLRDWAILLDSRAFRLWVIMHESADEDGIFSGTTVHLAELLNVRRQTISEILHGAGCSVSLVSEGLVRPIDRARWIVAALPHSNRPENRTLSVSGKPDAQAIRPENRTLDVSGKPDAQAIRPENRTLSVSGKPDAQGVECPENRTLPSGKPDASRALNQENSFIQQERQKTTTTSTKHPIPPAGASSSSSSSDFDRVDEEGADNARVSRLC